MNQVNLSGGQKARGMQTSTSIERLEVNTTFSFVSSGCLL